MESQTYVDFSAQLHQRLSGQRVPVSATIEVTRRCPLTCAHCYNNLPMGDRAARSSELTCQEHCRILDEIADAGCLWLLYSGGEIFARRDFLDIYTYAKQKGFLITLFTNGTLITPAIADTLVQWRPFCIEITLYGRTRETYERLTRIPGSYDRCIRGIRLLKERGLPLKLKTVGVTINRHEVWDMKQYAEEDLGVDFKFDSMINPRIDCSQSPLAVRLKPAEVVEFDLRDSRRIAEWRSFGEQFNGPVHARGHRDELYHCGGGIKSFAIDPQGKMSICVLSHFDTYDLRRGSFQDGWSHFLLKVRRKKIARVTKCTDCHIKAMCGMCPANGELENEDPNSPVDFLCHVAHLRATVFGMAIPPHGECEYCQGGSRYQDLMESVVELERRGVEVPALPESDAGMFPLLANPGTKHFGENLVTQEGGGVLPIVSELGNGCATGGCCSCGPPALPSTWEV